MGKACYFSVPTFCICEMGMIILLPHGSTLSLEVVNVFLVCYPQLGQVSVESKNSPGELRSSSFTVGSHCGVRGASRHLLFL